MLLTFGHGSATQDELVALLRAATVGLVVDVRRFPGSRRHPHVALAELERWLPRAGIRYLWEPRLGGRRRVPPDEAGRDPWWQVEAFHAYAAYARTGDFHTALQEVLDHTAGSPGSRTALMCSESLWWRCHRRIISDVLALAYDVPVLHLSHDGRLAEHVPAAGARLSGRDLYYDEG